MLPPPLTWATRSTRDAVGRPAAHGSPLISRSISARRSHPPYARQVEEHLNSRVYDWDRTAWSLFPPWRQQYFDGMETVRACGEPSFFVTVTANPLWPAIADALLPGQDTTGGLQLRRRVGAPAARAADSGRRDDAATAQLQLSLAAADIESCNAVYM